MPTPPEILKALYSQLVARRPVIDKTLAYYDGDHNLAFASQKFLEAFGGLFDAFADNWCGVVVDATAERLHVEGFRVNNDPKEDDDAKRIWEDNDMDLQAKMAHIDGLITGAHYATAWYRDRTAGQDPEPEITVESAQTTIVACHPKIRRRRTAALRTHLADDGYEHAELFLPDRVYLFRSRAKRTGYYPGGGRSEWISEDQLDVTSKLDASGSMENPLRVVPVVEFLNMPRLSRRRHSRWWGVHSEIHNIVPLQDACNKLLADMLIGSEFAAVPQRHLTGYEPDDELDAEGRPTGQQTQPSFRTEPGGVWWLAAENAKFGQFAAADLTSSVKSIEMVVQHIAAISRTPPHYLSPSADRLSGESIQSAETGLIAKCLDKQTDRGAGWEEIQRISGMIAGNRRLAEATSMATVWRDPATRTESEHIDALSKKAALGVPNEKLWEEMGYDADERTRFVKMLAAAQLEGAAANAAERARLAAEEAERLRTEEIGRTGEVPTAPQV